MMTPYDILSMGVVFGGLGLMLYAAMFGLLIDEQR